MKLSRLIIMTLALFFLGSCTQNNGDIEGLFGQWKVERITIDGHPDQGYGGNMVWAFQNDIVLMQIIGEHHSVESFYGTFLREGNLMTFNFTHSDDSFGPGTGPYVPPAVTHMPSGVFEVKILKIERSRIELQYISDNGTIYAYYLTKWG